MLKAEPSLKSRLIIPYTIIISVLCLGFYFFSAYGLDWTYQWVDFIMTWMRLDPDHLEEMRWFKKIFFYPVFYALKALFFIMGIALVMLTTFLLGNVLCAFFWEILIEQVFVLEGKQSWVFENESAFKKYATPLFRELIKEFIYIILFMIVWIVTIMPMIGPMISLVLGPIAIAFWFGYIVSDFSMSVMALKVKDRIKYGRMHFLYLTGVGIYALIPVLGILIYPLFVIGHAKNIATDKKLMPDALPLVGVDDRLIRAEEGI